MSHIKNFSLQNYERMCDKLGMNIIPLCGGTSVSKQRKKDFLSQLLTCWWIMPLVLHCLTGLVIVVFLKKQFFNYLLILNIKKG